jgi:putative membrane protein
MGMAAQAVVLIGALALAYEWASLRTRWSRWRGAAFMAGCALLVLGFATATHTVTGHMRQHLLIAMIAPIGLVLGAPVTLLLRTLPVGAARALTRLLRTRYARFVAHPVTALALTLGGLPLLWSPTAGHHPLVQLHFVLAGVLFAWVIAGPDPAPHRPSVRTRLIVLGVAIAAHATFSQVLYAGGDPDRQAGATLMYYGGDLAEILLAFAVVQSRPGRREPWPARDSDWPGRVRPPGIRATWSSWMRSRSSRCGAGWLGWRRGSGRPSWPPSRTPIPATSPPTSPAAPPSATGSSG